MAGIDIEFNLAKQNSSSTSKNVLAGRDSRFSNERERSAGANDKRSSKDGFNQDANSSVTPF